MLLFLPQQPYRNMAASVVTVPSDYQQRTPTLSCRSQGPVTSEADPGPPLNDSSGWWWPVSGPQRSYASVMAFPARRLAGETIRSSETRKPAAVLLSGGTPVRDNGRTDGGIPSVIHTSEVANMSWRDHRAHNAAAGPPLATPLSPSGGSSSTGS
ncbi:unnamed protein product [Gadus morhua 'NCC']